MKLGLKSLKKICASLAIVLIAVLTLSYAGVAYVLRYQLASMLFPRVSIPNVSAAPVAARVTDAAGGELLLRRYGQPRIGCAIFFPGQHGELSNYQPTVFRKFGEAGIAVFAVDYPGQDSATGSAGIRQVLDLSHRAALLVMQQCGQRRTAILGRSLGSMVAAYATKDLKPAAIVLDSAAPSLSSAISVFIRSRWYLYPFRPLPLHALLEQDYCLDEALANSQRTEVIIFQGTADRRTPIGDLRRRGTLAIALEEPRLGRYTDRGSKAQRYAPLECAAC
jgi:pimeloyl-ACP methyl ester carboxylesterase